ncbi:hypothetical protein NVV95_03345 [Herbiconiux sp. CPCC 205716]|uniref:Uncharacterized protein n=1 Tax=Herbiconiux gentiana TaxID=2970912 RepID=A0ABT2GBJ8_9MICO|nr:hypothetical protein [Herbiconiux gentiana]MCS5713587.1 hypothetical protein [Herbiconiux gentiana]
MIGSEHQPANRTGWFAVEGAFAAAVAALASSQTLLLVAAGNNVFSWSAAALSSLLSALGAGGWALLVGLVAWPLLNRRPLTVRERGFAALHIVAIGTAVPWIVLALVLGSWQATTITIVVAVVSGGAGGFFAARSVWIGRRLPKISSNPTWFTARRHEALHR